MRKPALGVSSILLLASGGAAFAQDAPPAKKLFTNVAKDAGFADVSGKTVVLADIDGDGWLDIVLDRRRFFLSDLGRSFREIADVGIEFPKTKTPVLDAKGSFDAAKAVERELVPQWLYFADVDGDGDLDAVAGVHSDWEWFDENFGKWMATPECDTRARTTVWLNDGKGSFTRGPQSGLSAKDAWGPSMALAVVDYDKDGRLDLFEGREYRRYGVLENCGGDHLWKGDGQGGFADVTAKAGMTVVPQPGLANSARPTYGVTVADFDGDGWPDLLQLAYGRQWNRQWKNRGDGTFTDLGMETGFAGDDITHGRYPEALKRPPEPPFRANGNTFDCAVADFDNDGDLDCFLGEIQHWWGGESSDPPSLLVNLGAKEHWKFERHPVQQFLPPRPSREPKSFNFGDMHAAWLDFDLDGLLDLLIASGDYPDGQFLRLYRQKPDHTFEEVTELAGFDWEGCGGVSIGDFDRDGDPDILVGRSFFRLSDEHRKKWMGGIAVPAPGLFRNDAVGLGSTGTNRNHWLNVRVVGKGAGHANVAGIGARIRVTTGEVTQLREVRCGSGLSNHQDPLEQIFGLGAASTIDRIEVTWPDAKGTVQVFTGVPADRFVTFVEGEAAPRVAPPAPR
jgi:hypothetical protein